MTCFDPDTEKFVHYQHEEKNPDALNNNSVYAICEGRGDTLWIGTNGGGVSRFDPESETFRHYPLDKNGPRGVINYILSLYQDTGGILWIGTDSSGLYRFDPETEDLSLFRDVLGESGSIIITMIYEDTGGTLWIGSDGGGLSRFVPDTRTFVRYRHDRDNPGSLSNDNIHYIFEDSSGNLWIGTGKGLNRLDQQTGTCIRYYEKDGLPNDNIRGIAKDRQGNLWISTHGGLSRFNPETRAFRNYDASDGLQSNQFTMRACLSARNSALLFFGGIRGFNMLYPERIRDNPNIPRVVFTDFQIFNQPVSVDGDSLLQKHINVTDRLILSYQHSVFSLQFAALNYHIPEKNQYVYMLEGFDKDWTYRES